MTKTNRKASAAKNASKGAKSTHPDLVQAGKFSLVGLLNTAIDFILLNICTSVFGFPLIPSNIISASAAMSFSFMANRQLVFKPSGKHYFKQAALFLIVTACGLYLLQNIIIFSLTEIWTWPLETGYRLVELLGLDSIFSRNFVFNNGAKVIATAASMVWNFIFYKRVVFKNA